MPPHRVVQPLAEVRLCPASLLVEPAQKLTRCLRVAFGAGCVSGGNGKIKIYETINMDLRHQDNCLLSYLCTILFCFLLCSIAHAQHSVGKMSVVAKCAVRSQKRLVVPGLEKLLEQIISVQTFTEQFRKPQTKEILVTRCNIKGC